jgi:hypothetical protein
MLKRYGFATKPPTLPSGKTCILEMQITDFAFSPKTLLPESCVRRIDQNLKGRGVSVPFYSFCASRLALTLCFPATGECGQS